MYRTRRPQSAHTPRVEERRDHKVGWDKCLELDLPTTRQQIIQHPTTILSNQHTDTNQIEPLWNKISSTPWTRRAKLCGGYGRKIMTPTISNEAPLYFQNPERIAVPDNMIAKEDARIIGSRVPRKQVPDAALFLLPGGKSILEARTGRPPYSGHRSFSHGKQSYFENNFTPRNSGSDLTPRTTMMIISSTNSAWPGARPHTGTGTGTGTSGFH